MIPFSLPWNDTAATVTDVSFLLEAPAGRDGFVRVEDGHLATGAGRRLRLWGVNFSFAAAFPPQEHAAAVARRLAKYGVNCVRLHHLDHPAPRGLLAADAPGSRQLDPAQLDRLDCFIARLKEHGIYVDLNLHVARRFTEADGVRDAALLGSAKAVTLFDPWLIELQKEYARALLQHRNPYTGLTYAEEPAIALIEITNENSLTEAWALGRLRGERTGPPRGAWDDIPQSYGRDLTARYNAWLRERFGSRAELAHAWAPGADDPPEARGLLDGEDPAAGTVARTNPRERDRWTLARLRTEAAFYAELERRYFREMAGYIREALGARQLLIGTSDHNHRWSGLPLLQTLAALDVVDGHVYWQHPRFPGEPWSRTDWRIDNTPMANAPAGSTIVQLARSAVAGRPFIVSEINHPFPSDYACEAVLTTAAYAALQDWDGVFWYSYAHAPVEEWSHNALTNYFDIHQDPTKLCQLVPGALLFLRGDVRPAQHEVRRGYAPEEVLDSLLRLARPGDPPWPLWKEGLPGTVALVHRVRLAGFDRSFVEDGASLSALRLAARFTSDTGEVVWDVSDPERGCIVIDAERVQALIGFVRPQLRTRHLEAQTGSFCALALASLDGRPVSQSARLLLTAAGRVANTGMEWNADRTSLGDRWGGPPVLIEPVMGALILRGLEGARAVRIQPLDPRGAPWTAPIRAHTAAGGAWAIALPSGRPSVWYLLTVQR
jgi:hypothetical protein